MNTKSPLSKPLKIHRIQGEIVLLGEGGVNFSMTLQAAAETSRALAAALEANVGAPERAAVVLVVEDEALIRANVTYALSEAGYIVIEAADADEALSELESGAEVHLLFTDVQMPGALDGLELARRVSARWPHTPLLICSGRQEIVGDALPPGGRFLHKPYNVGDMLRHVRELTAGA